MRSLLLLLYLLGWLAPNLAALEYFDVTNPRFRPLRVAVEIQNLPPRTTSDLFKLLERNLEQTLFFELDAQALPPARSSDSLLDPFSFQWTLQFPQASEARSVLRDVREDRVIADRSYPADTENLRPLALSLCDDLLRAVLDLAGVSQSRIAYTAKFPDQTKQIYVTNFDGSNAQRFSFELGSSNLPHWSFDNQRLLYTLFTSTATEIAIQPLDRPRPQRLRFPGSAQPLGGSWNPTANEILLTLMREGNSDIFRYHLDSNVLTPVIQWPSLETSPVWSPQGDRIAFVSDRRRFRQPGVYVHELATRTTTRLPIEGRYASAPRWSPDGKHLLLEALKERFFQIFKVTLDTGLVQQLTFGPFHSEQPDWAPNGQQIVFTSRRTGTAKLYYMSAYGGRMVRVTTHPANVIETAPAWSNPTQP
jgi:TolB protein